MGKGLWGKIKKVIGWIFDGAERCIIVAPYKHENLASSKINELQGESRFQNIPLSDGEIMPFKYWHTSGKGDIHSSKLSTEMVTVMGKPWKIDSSEAIRGRNAANTTRGIRRTNKVHRTDSRGPIIHEIYRRIRGRLWRSGDGRYRGPGDHCVETRMEFWSKIITDNT